MSENKKLLYIHPYYLPYYDVYDVFLTSNSYFIGNVHLKDQIKHSTYVNTEYWPKGIQFQKIYTKIKNLNSLIQKFNIEFIITKEIFSPISYKISKINKQLKFTHIIYCDETTKFNNSLWGIFPFTRYYAKYNINHNNYYIASSRLVLNNLLEMGIPKSHILCPFYVIFMQFLSNIITRA